MNLTFSKFGYTDESTGITSDKNTVSPGITPVCLCTDTGAGVAACGCPSEKTVSLLGPPISSLPVTGCTQHQAPSGYKYVNQNGTCVLADASGVPVPVATVPSTIATVLPAATSTVSSAITGITDKIKALYASNPTVFMVGAAAALYFFSKKK